MVMTAITDVKLIIDTLVGVSVPNAKVLKIVENTLSYNADLNWTNEQKAQEYKDRLISRMRQQAKAGAIKITNASLQATVAAAAVASEEDFTA